MNRTVTPANVYHGRRNDILAQRAVIRFQILIQGKLQTLRLAETRLIANRQFSSVNLDNIHDVGGNLTSDKDRLKRFGEFPRSTSLDESPELWNIFAGDMSSVAPAIVNRISVTVHKISNAAVSG